MIQNACLQHSIETQHLEHSDCFSQKGKMFYVTELGQGYVVRCEENCVYLFFGIQKIKNKRIDKLKSIIFFIFPPFIFTR